jgi:hypothetical protein
MQPGQPAPIEAPAPDTSRRDQWWSAPDRAELSVRGGERELPPNMELRDSRRKRTAQAFLF